MEYDNLNQPTIQHNTTYVILSHSGNLEKSKSHCCDTVASTSVSI